jgi:hypothetical protein
MRMFPPCFIVAVIAGTLLRTSMAMADVPPPDTMDCSSKKVGDACKDDKGTAGTCVSNKCSRINYACDGGPSPCGSVEYDCAKCTASSSKPGGCQTGSGSPTLGLGALCLVIAFCRRRRAA